MKSFNKFCGDVVSSRLPVWDFVSMAHDHASHSTGFYSISKASLTKSKLRLFVQELALIHRPMQGAEAFLVAQAETPKSVHAEMTLVAYLPGSTDGLGRNLQVFQYLGHLRRMLKEEVAVGGQPARNMKKKPTVAAPAQPIPGPYRTLFNSHDRLCLFEIYCTLIVDWGVEEEELREAIRLDKLEEMLLRRCGQINDPEIFPDAAMPRNGWKAIKKVPLIDLQPVQKYKAVVFYAQIRNGFHPAADGDNWIDLGFCTAPDARAELALVQLCTFDEFWRAPWPAVAWWRCSKNTGYMGASPTWGPSRPSWPSRTRTACGS
ncbi:hypothetical protein MGG_08313 [Pyricularia oryzae 70-15]|uniref:Uncharacterized protein n=1 Tax=Pyricularia oryzae (strain 70-15 / ATCC MYA-4617 / FGSC 8958) TaxID=242507 RepID=G4MWV2_PYRO7|nr:uncharacterized protein MGG_08313 [Pyricularia oryzae 70-15]EHA55956.1 hypothetical protein MGG_08313 [Pyricularia oryzae 70-15]